MPRIRPTSTFSEQQGHSCKEEPQGFKQLEAAASSAVPTLPKKRGRISVLPTFKPAARNASNLATKSKASRNKQNNSLTPSAQLVREEGNVFINALIPEPFTDSNGIAETSVDLTQATEVIYPGDNYNISAIQPNSPNGRDTPRSPTRNRRVQTINSPTRNKRIQTDRVPPKVIEVQGKQIASPMAGHYSQNPEIEFNSPQAARERHTPSRQSAPTTRKRKSESEDESVRDSGGRDYRRARKKDHINQRAHQDESSISQGRRTSRDKTPRDRRTLRDGPSRTPQKHSKDERTPNDKYKRESESLADSDVSSVQSATARGRRTPQKHSKGERTQGDKNKIRPESLADSDDSSVHPATARGRKTPQKRPKDERTQRDKNKRRPESLADSDDSSVHPATARVRRTPTNKERRKRSPDTSVASERIPLEKSLRSGRSPRDDDVSMDQSVMSARDRRTPREPEFSNDKETLMRGRSASARDYRPTDKPPYMMRHRYARDEDLDYNRDNEPQKPRATPRREEKARYGSESPRLRKTDGKTRGNDGDLLPCSYDCPNYRDTPRRHDKRHRRIAPGPTPRPRRDPKELSEKYHRRKPKPPPDGLLAFEHDLAFGPYQPAQGDKPKRTVQRMSPRHKPLTTTVPVPMEEEESVSDPSDDGDATMEDEATTSLVDNSHYPRRRLPKVVDPSATVYVPDQQEACPYHHAKYHSRNHVALHPDPNKESSEQSDDSEESETPADQTRTTARKLLPKDNESIIFIKAPVCPECKNGTMKKSFTTTGVFLASIFPFCFGPVCCFWLRRQECTNCGHVASNE